MKRLLAVLLVAAIALCFVACDDGEQSQTTTAQPSGNNQIGSTDIPQSSTDIDSSTSATTHPHSHSGGEGTTVQGGEESTTDGQSEDEQSSTTLTTAQGEQTTTQIITTTTKKGQTTTTGKSTTSTTTKPTTTTTTTKKTTTTTKKTTTAHKTHTFSAATYSKNDINTHNATGKCTVCGITVTQSEAHSWGAWITYKNPTATATGQKYRVCKHCGTEQDIIVPPTSVNTSNFPKEMFDLVNAERAKRGLPAFTYYTAEQAGANTRAKEISVYFSHNRPDGTKWWTVSGLDKSCQMGAENIARGHATPEDVMAAFMNSADHRENILSTKYTHIVIAYYEGAWVQIFTKPW